MQKQIQQYKVGDMVWAKITGYPWWPAKVFNRAERTCDQFDLKQEYSVMFFGDNSHAYLSASKLASFQEKYQQFTVKQLSVSKKFQQALEKANEFILTRQRSLQDQNAVIDIFPICSSLDKSTTFAYEDKLHRMVELQQISETGGLLGHSNNFQQKILFQQFSDSDLNNINQTNIVQLLEQGFISSIRDGGYSQQFLHLIEQKLKHQLLKKYNLQVCPMQKTSSSSDQSQPKHVSLKNKKIFKKRSSAVEDNSCPRELQMKRLCIMKVYNFLKCNKIYERGRAMKQSIFVVERLIYKFSFYSYQFQVSFKKVLKWLSAQQYQTQYWSSDSIKQRFQIFLDQMFGKDNLNLDQKSKTTEYTAFNQAI